MTRSQNNSLWILFLGGLVLFSAILLLFSTPFAPGVDGYYYALQIRDNILPDPSLYFPLARFFNLFLKNAVVTVKILSLFSQLICVLFLYFYFEKRSQSRFESFLLAAVVGLSPLWLYFGMEFQKNFLAMAFFIAALYFMDQESLNKKMMAIPLILLVFFIHKGVAVYLGALSGILVLRGIYHTVPKQGRAWVIVGLILIMGLGITAGTLKGADLHRILSELRWAWPWQRYGFVLHAGISYIEKAWFILLSIFPFLFPFMHKIFCKKWWPQDAFLHSSWLALILFNLPFLYFDFGSLPFRFLLISLPLVAMLLQNMLTGRASQVILIVLILSGLLSSLYYLPRRQPDYPAYQETIETIKQVLPPGHALLAHEGLNDYIWYETGFKVNSFLPNSHAERYYRVVYGLRGTAFHALARKQSLPEAITLSPSYIMVYEPLYRMFEDTYPENNLLKDFRNHLIPRPEGLYFVDPFREE